MIKVVPESCETCLFSKGCNSKIDIILSNQEKCSNYVMSDECCYCCICPDVKCFNFGSCFPKQQKLF